MFLLLTSLFGCDSTRSAPSSVKSAVAPKQKDPTSKILLRTLPMSVPIHEKPIPKPSFVHVEQDGSMWIDNTFKDSDYRWELRNRASDAALDLENGVRPLEAAIWLMEVIRRYPWDMESYTDLVYVMDSIDTGQEEFALRICRQYALINTWDPNRLFPEMMYWKRRMQWGRIIALAEKNWKNPRIHDNYKAVLADAYEKSGMLDKAKTVQESRKRQK